MNTKEIQIRISLSRSKLRLLKPRCWKFIPAVPHIDAAKDSELEHLFWREIRFEFRIKMLARWLGAIVSISLLHSIIDSYPFAHKHSSYYFALRNFFRISGENFSIE